MQEMAQSTTPFGIEKAFHMKEKNVSEILEKRISSHLALWKSYEEGGGVNLSILRNSHSSSLSKIPVESQIIQGKDQPNIQKKPPTQTTLGTSSPHVTAAVTEKSMNCDDGTSSIPFDENGWVGDSHRLHTSLPGESNGGIKNYDVWQVMKDEDAKDAGFDYVGEMTGEAQSADTGREGFFRILGTWADDVSSQPHVLSPPLMESLLSFVPDQLTEENLWLKFSMVRDGEKIIQFMPIGIAFTSWLTLYVFHWATTFNILGASLETLQEICQHCHHSFLAVETIEGDVFGSFTSNGWNKHAGFYGNGEAFLWKMRYNRLTPCFSLIEQANLESDIDVYPYSGRNKYVQLCTDKLIALGGGKADLKSYIDVHGTRNLTHGQDFGFAIAIDKNLLRGTTSLCETFNNPPLLGYSSEGQVFKVLNLEIWAFTPCATVTEAEHMEMAKVIRTEPYHETRQGISTFLGSSTTLQTRCEMEHIILRGG